MTGCDCGGADPIPVQDCMAPILGAQDDWHHELPSQVEIAKMRYNADKAEAKGDFELAEAMRRDADRFDHERQAIDITRDQP